MFYNPERKNRAAGGICCGLMETAADRRGLRLLLTFTWLARRGRSRETSVLGEQWRRFADNWREFLRQERGMVCLTIFTVLFVYGIRLAGADLSIDTEIMLNDQQEVLDSWIGIGRFGLVFTKKLFGFARLVPWTENLMMILALMGTGAALSFAVWDWCGRREHFSLAWRLIPALYLTGPCFAEQFHFTLQAFPVAFAMGLAVAAVYFMEKWAWKKESPLWLLLGVCLGVWAAGTYQVLAASLVALFAMAYFLRITGEERNGGFLAAGLRSAAAFAVCFVLYVLLSEAVKAATGCYSQYVEGQMHWSEGIRICLHYIYNDVMRILNSTEIFYHPWTGAVLAAFVLTAGWKIIRMDGGAERKLCACFSLGMTAAAPFYLTVATGYYQPARAQMVYPLAFAFWTVYLTAAVKGWMSGKGRPAVRKIAVGVLCVACGVIALGQAQVTTGLFRTAEEVSRNDQLLLNRIYSRVEEVADTEDMDQVMILLVGKKDPVLPEDSLMGDTIGYSFFNWGDELVGVTGRIFTENGLGQVLGMEYGQVNVESYENAVKSAAGRPSWPAKDSVWEVSRGVIAVKLSEPD